MRIPTNPSGVDFAIARTLGERKEAFSLVHEAYVRAGNINPHSSGVRASERHLSPETSVLVARRAGVIVATVSLIFDGTLGLPIDAAIDVSEHRHRSARLAEISSFTVVEPDLTLPLIQFLYRHCIERGVDRLVIACTPTHSRFYQRMIGFSVFAALEPYGDVVVRAEALFLDLESYRRNGGRFPLHAYLESAVPQPPTAFDKAS
jgi:hypothetical protein